MIGMSKQIADRYGQEHNWGRPTTEAMTQSREPQPFKNHFNAAMAEDLATRVAAVYPAFPGAAFVQTVVPQLASLELKGRIAAFAEGLRATLPPHYPEAVRILSTLLGPAHNESKGMYTDGWALAPLAAFVEYYGLEHFDDSMAALHAITQRHTAEFAIRPFLVHYPAETLAVLQHWVHDTSFHVRRLVSEGTRTRLPWAARLPQFIADPAPVLALLEELKDDPTLYVRTSVANNLNDIAKDHPELVLATLARWSEDTNAERQSIIRRALRTLVKQGHPEALRLLAAEAPQVELLALHVAPQQVMVGDVLTISTELRSTTPAPQQVIIDYIMHYRGARGELRPKVFKWRTGRLGTGESLRLVKRHSFRPVTIRRLYTGRHRIELQVNGVILGGVEFELVAEEHRQGDKVTR